MERVCQHNNGYPPTDCLLDTGLVDGSAAFLPTCGSCRHQPASLILVLSLGLDLEPRSTIVSPCG